MNHPEGMWTWDTTSPVGPLTLSASSRGLMGLHMHGQAHVPAPPQGIRRDRGPFGDALDQLEAYFAGDLTLFDLPLDLRGTPFQMEVWAGLCRIGFAETWSYGRLAAEIGRPGASRAVGLANGRNPVGIIVPCHRVIGADGTLTGYGGGLDRKAWLLDHERRVAGMALPV